ncbi:MAG: P1 family peptidase [Alphaproteobacteria bacterium]|nr:P1 family peptidase [Alphaproteobacteria bacterium]
MSTITAVPGVLAGHWTGEHTGVTVVLTPDGARGAVVVPGSAPGSRELATLEPHHLAGGVHGVCLSGGSAFGLAAADGVMAHLAETGVGFEIPGGPVPIVPAAILYDLDKGPVRPGPAEGRAAAAAASTAPLETGRVGAARGATVGRTSGSPVPGWLGSAAVHVDIEGLRACVGAVVALNALGSIVDPATGAWLAGGPLVEVAGAPRANTTLAVVATDAPLDAGTARVLAQMAVAGLARCIRPAFTPFDGDIVFALSTGRGPSIAASALLRLGEAAATAVEGAIVGR